MRSKLIVILLSLSLLGGCSWHPLGIFGKNSQKQAQIAAEFSDLDKETNKEQDKRLDLIGVYSVGTDFALSQASNSPAVHAARETNERVSALANQPSLEQSKEIKEIVSLLISNNIQGELALEHKDKEIKKLKKEIADTEADKQAEVEKARKLATKTAQIADNATTKLDKLKGNFGLNAIFFGISTLLKDLMWVIGGVGLVFVVLRIFASANPICGALFSIFEVAFSWLVNCIKVIAPKAINIAGAVSKELYDEANQLLGKIVDSIEWIRKTEQTTGKLLTVQDLLNELSKNLDSAEKAKIDDLKKKLGYT